MSFIEPSCESCGLPAVVHIAKVAVGGGPQMRHLCFTCADEHDTAAVGGQRGLNCGAAVAAGGTMVVAVSVFADSLAFGSAVGFGWQQLSGMALAGVITIIAAIMRTPTLLVIGIMAAVMTLLADLLAFGSAAGFGWQQILGCVVGVALLVYGISVARRQAFAQ